MHKQPGSTLSTSINGSRSCYITTNKFAFLSVETILARTIHISNNFLNRLCSPFKNVHSLTKRQEKGVCLFFKRNIPHLTHRPTLRTLIIASAKRLKRFLCRQSLPKHFVFGQYTSPIRIILLLSYPESGVNVLHIVIAFKNITLVSNKKSILVENFDFAVTQVDNFWKNELITVMFKVFDGENASVVLFKPE